MRKILPHEKNTKAFCKCVERLETLSKIPLLYVYNSPRNHPGCFSMYLYICCRTRSSTLSDYSTPLYYILVVFCHAQLMLLRSFRKVFCYIHTMVLYLCDRVIWKGVLHIYLAQNKKYYWKLCSFLSSTANHTRTSYCKMIWMYAYAFRILYRDKRQWVCLRFYEVMSALSTMCLTHSRWSRNDAIIWWHL